MKIAENRGLEGSKIEENRCLEASWRVWARLGASWGLWRDFGGLFWRHCGEDGRNIGHVGAKLAASCAKMAMLGSVWEALVEFWEHFWSILADALDVKNFEKP